MSPVLAVTMLVFAIVGGIIGWRRASKPLPRPIFGRPEPLPEKAEREEWRRRLHRRIRLTLIYALLGAVVGLLGLKLFDRPH